MINIAHSIPLIACATTVAIAAPMQPHLNMITHTRSSAMFKTVDIARNTNGVLLSPTERNTLESRLYKSVNGMPRNITSRYLYASSKIFDGVERSFNISLQSTAQTVVNTNAVMAVITIEL